MMGSFRSLGWKIIGILFWLLCTPSSSLSSSSVENLRAEYYYDYNPPACLSSSETAGFDWTLFPSYDSVFNIHVNEWETSFVSNLIFYYIAKEVMNRKNVQLKVLRRDKRQIGNVSALGHVYSNIDAGLVDLTLETWLWDYTAGQTQEYILVKRSVSGAPTQWDGRHGIYLTSTLSAKLPTLDMTTYTALNDASLLNLMPAWNAKTSVKVNGIYQCTKIPRVAVENCDPNTGNYVPTVCKGDPTQCRQMWRGPGANGDGYTEQVIEELGLKYIVVYLETDLSQVVDTEIAAGTEFMATFYEPEVTLAKQSSSFFRVNFPTPSLECLQKSISGGAWSCDFAPVSIHKLSLAEFSNIDKDLNALFGSLALTIVDLMDILKMVSAGQGIPQATCQWLKSNTIKWKDWVPVMREVIPAFQIGFIGRFAGERSSYYTNSFYLGYELALHQFSKKNNAFFSVQSPTLLIGDAGSSVLSASWHTMRFWSAGMVGLVSEVDTATATTIASLASAVPVPQLMSNVFDDAIFSKANYPTLCTSGGSPSGFASSLLKLFLDHGWHNPFFTYFAEDQNSIKVIQLLSTMGRDFGMRAIQYRFENSECPFAETRCQDQMLLKFQASSSRVIYIFGTFEVEMILLRRAKSLGMVGKGKSEYQFIFGIDGINNPGALEEFAKDGEDFVGLIGFDIGVKNTPRKAEFVREYEAFAPSVFINDPLFGAPLYPYQSPGGGVGINGSLASLAFYGYDSGTIMLNALNATVLELRSLGIHPQCLTMLTFHPSCFLSNATRDAIYDEATCAGKFKSSNCIPFSGVSHLMTSTATGSEKFGKIANYVSTLFLTNIYRLRLEGLTGTVRMTERCARDNVFFHMNNLQSLKVNNGTSTTIQLIRKNVALYSSDTNFDPYITPRYKKGRATLVGATSSVVYSGSTADSPIYTIPLGISRPMVSCSTDVQDSLFILWFEDWDDSLFPLSMNIVYTVSLSLVCVVIVGVAIFTIYQLSKTQQDMKEKENRLLRRNAENYLSILFILVEFWQVIRIPMNASVAWNDNQNSVVNDVFGVFGLAFDLDWYYGIIVATTLLWVVYAGIYYFDGVILLSRYRIGRIFLTPAAEYLKFIASAGYIPIVDGLLSVFSCGYVPPMEGVYLVPFCKVHCQSNEHYAYMVISLLLLLSYLPVTCMMGHIAQELDRNLDLKMFPFYFSSQNLLKFSLVFMSQFFHFYPIPYLSILSGIFIIQFLEELVFKPCSRDWVNFIIALRAKVGLVSCLILLLFEILDTKEVAIPLSVLAGTNISIVSGSFIYFRKVYLPIMEKIETKPRRVTVIDFKIRFWNPFKGKINQTKELQWNWRRFSDVPSILGLRKKSSRSGPTTPNPFLSASSIAGTTPSAVQLDNAYKSIENPPPWECLGSLIDVLKEAILFSQSEVELASQELGSRKFSKYESNPILRSLMGLPGSEWSAGPREEEKIREEQLQQLVENVENAELTKPHFIECAWKKISAQPRVGNTEFKRLVMFYCIPNIGVIRSGASYAFLVKSILPSLNRDTEQKIEHANGGMGSSVLHTEVTEIEDQQDGIDDGEFPEVALGLEVGAFREDEAETRPHTTIIDEPFVKGNDDIGEFQTEKGNNELANGEYAQKRIETNPDLEEMHSEAIKSTEFLGKEASDDTAIEEVFLDSNLPQSNSKPSLIGAVQEPQDE
eukprot:Nk52_evm2s168 gene=Nk52_evmTU2s168